MNKGQKLKCHPLPFMSAVSPKSYYLSRGSLTSTNGSTTAQECSGRIDNQCTNPTYSVLFDGVIPTLIGLDGNTWASQLFTMQVNSPTILHFTLQRSPDRIEVVLFNCPAWRIAVQTIRLLNTETPNVIQWVSSEIQVRTSCESLVRVCISTTNTESRQFAVYFTHSDTSSWLHLAEIMFLSGPLSPCHSGIIPITTTTQSKQVLKKRILCQSYIFIEVRLSNYQEIFVRLRKIGCAQSLTENMAHVSRSQEISLKFIELVT